MGGAPSTGYDVLSSTPGEAMKKPSRAGGGKPAKARSRRSPRLKRNIQSKATTPRSAATQQLGEWLGILGMSEYVECFAENDIDLSVIPHLTDHDLKELGVSLGHRRKMLAAIAERTGAVEAPPRPTSTETKPPGGGRVILDPMLSRPISAWQDRQRTGSFSVPHRVRPLKDASITPPLERCPMLPLGYAMKRSQDKS